MSKCAREELWTPLGVATEALAQVLCALRFALWLEQGSVVSPCLVAPSVTMLFCDPCEHHTRSLLPAGAASKWVYRRGVAGDLAADSRAAVFVVSGCQNTMQN